MGDNRKGGKMRWRIPLLLTLASAIFYGGYYLHYRDVRTGTFDGLTIGSSKETVFLAIDAKSNVSGIVPLVPNLRITSENVEDLDLIRNVDAFMITGPGVQIRVEMRNGEITHVSRHFSDQKLDGEWQGIDQMIPAIAAYLRGELDAAVFAVPRSLDFGALHMVSTMPQHPPSIREIEWLFSFDHWQFNEDDRYTSLDLFFQHGKLARIEFRNYFMELP